MSMHEKKDYQPSYSKESIHDIAELPCLAIEARGIDQRTAEHFGVRTAVSTGDGRTPVAHYFPYFNEDLTKLVAFKKIDLTKEKKERGHFTSVGDQGVHNSMFGAQVCNKSKGVKLIVTEGEYDCLAAWQVLKTECGKEYRQNNPNVVSISNGTINAVDNIGQPHNMKIVKRFKDTTIAFDNDARLSSEKKGIMRGKEATTAVHGLLPHIKVAPLPEGMDCCDYFKSDPKQLYWALVKPMAFRPDGYIDYKDIRDDAIKPPERGKPFPWETLTKVTLGKRKGEVYFIAAGVNI